MSGVITEKGITVRQGDSFPIVLYFHDEQGAKDITGCEIRMQIRDNEDKVMCSKTAIIEDTQQGHAVITLTPQDTNMPVGEYYTDIQMKESNGNVHTVYPQNVNAVAFFKITTQITE